MVKKSTGKYVVYKFKPTYKKTKVITKYPLNEFKSAKKIVDFLKKKNIRAYVKKTIKSGYHHKVLSAY